MNKKNNTTTPTAKKLTINDLKQVIGGVHRNLEVEGFGVEDTQGNKADFGKAT